MEQGHFEERAPHEAGFAKVFASGILPIFRGARDEGLARIRRIRMISWVIFGAGIAFTLWLLITYPFADKAPRWLLPVFAFASFGIFAGALVQGARAKFNTGIKAKIAPLIADFLGYDRYTLHPGNDWVDLRGLHARALLPFYNSGTIEDAIEGRWRGVTFRMAEVLLTERDGASSSNNASSVVFRGQVITVDTPVEMPEIVFVAQKGAILAHSRRRILDEQGLRPMPFGDSDVHPYEVFADRPDKAAGHVSPAFADTLMAIATANGTRTWRLTAAFRGKSFTLCLYTGKSFLEVEALERSEMEFAESCREALDDMVLPRRVIDLLIDGPA